MTNSLHRRRLLGIGAAAAAGFAAGPALARTLGPARFDWTLHPPDSVGMSQAGLEGVRAALQKRIDSNDTHGVVTAIARDNKLVWFEAQGVRDPGTGAAMRKDDIFRLASSTKPVTTVCILILMEAGKLSLDDEVSRFIPTFAGQKVIEPPPGWEKALTDSSLRAEMVAHSKFAPARRDVTIRELLTHTSGLMSAGDGGWGPGALVDSEKMIPGPEKTLAEVVPEFGHAALDYQPGTRWRYSPLAGFDTLGRIVEVASGQPLEVFMRERLFEPLRMVDTHFNLPPEKRERLVPFYERKDGAWKRATALFGNGPVKYISGAGGLMSTVHDYMQFEAMLYNGGELNGRRVLKPETVDLMATNQVGELMVQWLPAITAGMGYGLGVGVTVDPAKADNGRGRGAFGWDGAFGTDGWVDREFRLAVVYFVQQAVRPARVEFQKAVRAAIVA